MSSIVQEALRWASMGVPVFPCSTNKVPLTPNGHKDATVDPVAITQMFELAGDCYIGAQMGANSKLFACDFDIYKPGAAGKAAEQFMADLLAKGVLPPTQRHRTVNGGLHLIYESDDSWPNCKPSPGVEVKGEGGYIIVPPSKGYIVEDDGGFAKAPKALIDLLMSARTEYTGRTTRQHEEAIISAESFHDAITSIAAKMFRQGRPASEIMAKILAALSASVASNPSHPRHERWNAFMEDKGGELSRILNSGRSKYDTSARMDTARENLSEEVFDRVREASARLGFSSPNLGYNQQEPKALPSPDDYGSSWPFEGDGYFAHQEIDVTNQLYILHPLFAENETIVMAADPKSGKTSLSIKLAFGLATGVSPCKSFTIPQARGVLYFSLEGKRAVQLRIEAEKRYQKEQGVTLPDDIPLFVVERHTNFMDQQDDTVAKIVAAHRYMKEKGVELGLIVIDTLTKAMPGFDQNSVEDTSKLFDMTPKLRDYGVNASIMFVHHTGKDGRTRGSSNIEADVDTVLKVRAQEDGSSLLYVHMARSMDDNLFIKFNLLPYELGVTSQGIKQSAPVLVFDHEVADSSTEAAVRAQTIKPWLELFLGMGVGTHSVKDVGNEAMRLKLVNGRLAGKLLTEALDLVFDRELSVVYRAHTITAVKQKEAYTHVVVREPGRA